MTFLTNSIHARARRLLAALLAGACLAGCGALASVGALVSGAPGPVKPAWNTLALAAAADANTDSALAVDVVLVKDKALLETLAGMSAARYFAARADLQRTFPDALTVLAAEITPGQLIRFEQRRFGREPVWAALVFANYANPGEHRQRLALTDSACLVQLNAQGFTASAVKTGAAR